MLCLLLGKVFSSKLLGRVRRGWVPPSNEELALLSPSREVVGLRVQGAVWGPARHPRELGLS